ncbi:MAG: hypothetical protein M0018_00145 [Nitrospiraceae bacterium]|nr:hypothetical protein [Nitrospiraceae bacterium]
MKKVRRFLAPLVMAALVAGSAGCVAEVRTPPPAARVEVVGAAPYPGAVWVGGFWAWSYGRYVWRPGHWARRPWPRAVWVPGHWRETPRGWRWRGGHWR